MAAEGGRKLGVCKCTNWGYSPPRAFFHREVKEYDRIHHYEAGSSFVAPLPPLPPTTEEEERVGLGPADFIDSDLSAVMEFRVREVDDDFKRRLCDDDIERTMVE